MVVGHEVYSFFDGFFYHHQIMITPKDKYKTSFMTNWGGFVWLVMPFGLKNNSINIPKGGQFGMFKTFFSLDDFNDLKRHLNKLKNVEILVLALTLRNSCFWCILV
jgi:hypothetical protein